jgi:hypothetical protein
VDGLEVDLAKLGDLGSGFGRRVGRTRVGGRQLVGDPGPALRDRVRERHHGLHIGQRHTRLRAQVERHRQVDLPLDPQLAVEGERVEGDRDRPFDHVLDGHKPGVELTPLDGVDDVGHRSLCGAHTPRGRPG